jgi:purine operon repressor
MKKYKRNQRIGALMKIFAEKPNYLFSYNYFDLCILLFLYSKA